MQGNCGYARDDYAHEQKARRRDGVFVFLPRKEQDADSGSKEQQDIWLHKGCRYTQGCHQNRCQCRYARERDTHHRKQNTCHDPGQPKAGAVRFGKRQEHAFFRCPKVAQCIPCRAEAVQERISREQDNEQQCRQQDGEQQLRFSEMSDNRSSDAGQNTCPKQPEHCRKAAYRVTNRGKREKNQDAGKQIKKCTFLIAAFLINAGTQAGQILLFHIRPSLQFQLGELRGVVFLIEPLTAGKRGQAAN